MLELIPLFLTSRLCHLELRSDQEHLPFLPKLAKLITRGRHVHNEPIDNISKALKV